MSNVPKLRFKEFSGDWNKNNIPIKIVSGNTYPLNAYSKEGTLLIQGLNIYPNELKLDNPIYISDNHLTGKDVLVSKEDILVGLNRPIIGKKLKACLFLKDSAVLYQRAGILNFDKSKLSNRFLYQYLFAPSFIKQLLIELVGSDQPYIKSDLFKVTRNIFPSKQEQEKIASFLTSVDTKIEQLTKKEELLKQYKKGVMQKIFSQEIRFKADDGREFPSWKKRKLNELMYEHKERNIDDSYTKNDVLSVSGEFGIVNQIEFQGRSFAGASINNYHVVKVNDIVYTKSPLKANPYGIVKVNKKKAGVVSTLYAVYRPKENLNPLFIDYYFQMDDNVNRYFRPLVHKGAKNDMKINNSYAISDSISIPELEEQSKIVVFFQSLDDKIQKFTRQLEATKQFKKALLQQMFV